MAAVLVALTSAAPPAAPPGWEQVYSATNPRAAFAAILVVDDGKWVAAGGRLIVKGGTSSAEPTVEPGKYIVGLAGGQNEPLLALGGDDLILRWDGKAWNQESFAADAAKLSRPRRRALLLQGAVHPAGEPLIAYGPWRVLVRQSDGTWKAPAEKERYRLMVLSQLGPDTARPKGCDRLQWRWLTGGQAWLACRDGRNYLVDSGGAVVDRGRLPKSCAESIGTVVRRKDVLFVTCDDGKVWRSEDGRWERLPSPKLDGIAVDAHCLYGISEKAVWRNCSAL